MMKSSQWNTNDTSPQGRFQIPFPQVQATFNALL